MESIRLELTEGTSWLSRKIVKHEMNRHASLLETVKKREEQYRDSLGWLDVEEWAGEEWLSKCEKLAAYVKERADVLVVVGIGGSNQAARAVAEAIGEKSSVKLVFSGNNISADDICSVVKQLEDKRVFINVIAKNFETLEPGICFWALRNILREKYGAAYSDHVICTGTIGSHFERLSKDEGYHFLPFPDNIGGRYTALSPVGLFPLAVAGIDIRKMAHGGKKMQERLYRESAEENIALEYAVVRNLLYQKGFRMEMLSFFEPRYYRFAKWWRQLFGESEGKDNKGLYPVYGSFSEDLHSIGQFIQEGTAVIFETFLNVEKTEPSFILRHDGLDDRFVYLDGMDFTDINRAAYEATVAAHSKRLPCMKLTVPAIDEESFGQLFYFYEFTCYLSAKLLGVNPFDQPGVEAYKQYMFQKLGKPQTVDCRKQLEDEGRIA